jgi:hypothetical protein
VFKPESRGRELHRPEELIKSTTGHPHLEHTDRGERRGKVQKLFVRTNKGPKDWPSRQTAQRTVNSHNES